MKKQFKKIGVLSLVFMAMFVSIEAFAQCPMCKAAVEANLEDGGEMAKGLNTGILYMFFTPYIIVGFITYIWWKNKKNYDDEADRIDLLED